MVEVLQAERRPLPAIHLVSGRATSLEQLSQLPMAAGVKGAHAVEAPARDYDVDHFRGDPSRAKRLLGWTPRTSIEEGVRRMVAAFSDEVGAPASPSSHMSAQHQAPVSATRTRGPCDNPSGGQRMGSG